MDRADRWGAGRAPMTASGSTSHPSGIGWASRCAAACGPTPPNQGRLLVSYPNVPLRGHLYGRGGHTANSSVFARAPVNLEVTVGDLPAQRFKFELKDTDRPFMLSIPETGTATVTFAISSPDAGTNHFCFWADIRR